MPIDTPISSPGPEAAEYALRLLPEDEQRAFEAEMRRTPALRGEVVFWNTRLARFADEVEEVRPPSGLRKQIEHRLFGKTRGRGLGWLAGALSAAALAILGLAMLGPGLRIGGETEIAAERYGTTLVTENGRMTLDGTADDRDLTVEVSGPGPAAGTTYELWAVPEGEAAVLLGRIGSDPVQRFTLPASPTAMELAISLEDENGSPGDGTHGPVIAREFLAPRS